MNIVDDSHNQGLLKAEPRNSGQDVIRKLSLDHREARFSLVALAVERARKPTHELADGRVFHPARVTIARQQSIPCLQVGPNVAMIGQTVEARVQRQSLDMDPPRFLPGHGLEFSRVASGSPTDVLAEGQKRFSSTKRVCLT